MKTLLNLRTKDNKTTGILGINSAYYEPTFTTNGNITTLSWTPHYANGILPPKKECQWQIGSEYVIIVVNNYYSLCNFNNEIEYSEGPLLEGESGFYYLLEENNEKTFYYQNHELERTYLIDTTIEIPNNSFCYDIDASILYYYSGEKNSGEVDEKDNLYKDKAFVALTNPDASGAEIVDELPAEDRAKTNRPYFDKSTNNIYTYTKETTADGQSWINKQRYTHNLYVAQNNELDEYVNKAQSGDLILILDESENIIEYCDEVTF